MVTAADIQAAVQLPQIRPLAKLQITRPVQRIEGCRTPQINGVTLYEMVLPLIPADFEGRVCIYVDVIEITEPPKVPSAE